MDKSDAWCAWLDEQERLAELCAGALAESRRLVARGVFRTTLPQLLDRACNVLDQLDEVLVRLDPQRDPNAFARSAALHRELEAIQARIPREYRRLRGDSGAPVSVPALTGSARKPALRLVK